MHVEQGPFVGILCHMNVADVEVACLPRKERNRRGCPWIAFGLVCARLDMLDLSVDEGMVQ